MSFVLNIAALLQAFFSELQWSPTGASGELTDTSLIELCILATQAIGGYSPVYCGGQWRLVGADPLVSVVDLDVKRLFRTWKRAFVALGCPAGLPYAKVGVSTSACALRVRLTCFGVSGCFAHPNASSQEFVDLCGLSSTLGGIQLPML